MWSTNQIIIYGTLIAMFVVIILIVSMYICQRPRPKRLQQRQLDPDVDVDSPLSPLTKENIEQSNESIVSEKSKKKKKKKKFDVKSNDNGSTKESPLLERDLEAASDISSATASEVSISSQQIKTFDSFKAIDNSIHDDNLLNTITSVLQQGIVIKHHKALKIKQIQLSLSGSELKWYTAGKVLTFNSKKHKLSIHDILGIIEGGERFATSSTILVPTENLFSLLIDSSSPDAEGQSVINFEASSKVERDALAQGLRLLTKKVQN